MIKPNGVKKYGIKFSRKQLKSKGLMYKLGLRSKND
jgi:hypothetical protein